MIFNKRKWVQLGMSIGLLLSALGISAQEIALDEETFFVAFIPNVQFAPLYVGIEQGIFADANIQLTLQHGDEPLGVDLISSGQLNFGLISGEQVILARSQDRPIKTIFQWFQAYPIAVVATLESGIESVEDLRGRTVGIPGRFGLSYSGLTAILEAHDMTEADINLQEIGFNAPEVVCVGGVEASVVYMNNEPLQIANRAELGDCGDVTGVRVFPVSDAASLVASSLVTNETMITEHADLVQRMVDAYHVSLQVAIQNPAQAYLDSAGHVEGLFLEPELQTALEEIAEVRTVFLAENPDVTREQDIEYRRTLRAELGETFDSSTLLQFDVLLASIDLWDADVLGAIDPEAWETSQSVLMQIDMLTAPIDLTEAYTAEFLTE